MEGNFTHIDKSKKTMKSCIKCVKVVISWSSLLLIFFRIFQTGPYHALLFISYDVCKTICLYQNGYQHGMDQNIDMEELQETADYDVDFDIQLDE